MGDGFLVGFERRNVRMNINVLLASQLLFSFFKRLFEYSLTSSSPSCSVNRFFRESIEVEVVSVASWLRSRSFQLSLRAPHTDHPIVI